MLRDGRAWKNSWFKVCGGDEVMHAFVKNEVKN